MARDINHKSNFIVVFIGVKILYATVGLNFCAFASGMEKNGGSKMTSSINQTAAGNAAGYLSLNGKRISLNYAYVLAQPNSFDDNKIDTAVLLMEKPISEDELKEIQGLEYVAHKKRNYALFKINDKGKPIYEVIEHPVLNDTRLMMSGFTSAEFVPSVSNMERLEGSFQTPGETDFGGYKYEISVTFKAKVEQSKRPEPLPDAKSGKPLPANGGDPANAYLAYLKAIEKKDVAGIRKLFQLPAGAEATDDEIRESLEFMEAAAPKIPKFTNGFVNLEDNRAVIYFSGTKNGKKLYGTIGLVKKLNIWMVTEETWSNVPPKK